MIKKHPKIYYVGGLISLIFLPLLFFISTSEVRKKAVRYGSIEIQLRSDDYGSYHHCLYSLSDSLYIFIGKDEATKLSNFQQYCQTHKQNSRSVYQLHLSETCNYDFFVQVLDILYVNRFGFDLHRNTIRFTYQPNLVYRQVYEPSSTTEELQYVVSELSEIISNSKIISTIKEFLPHEPIHIVKTNYIDLGPPPSLLYRELQYPTICKIIKEEPRSSIYFRSIGLWVIPIILIWLFLLILSIRRNRKLLPNQRLKLTE